MLKDICLYTVYIIPLIYTWPYIYTNTLTLLYTLNNILSVLHRIVSGYLKYIRYLQPIYLTNVLCVVTTTNGRSISLITKSSWLYQLRQALMYLVCLTNFLDYHSFRFSWQILLSVSSVKGFRTFIVQER